VKEGRCGEECKSSEECVDGSCYAKEKCGNDSECEGGEYVRKCRDNECTGKFSENCKAIDGFDCHDDNTIDIKYRIPRKRGECIKKDDCKSSEECVDGSCYSNKNDIDSRIAECPNTDDCTAVACDATHATCDLYSDSTLIPVMGTGATTYIKN